MYCVTVCVIFIIIVGNLSGTVIRTRRDLEQMIHEFYGQPETPKEMRHHPHQMPSQPDHNKMTHDDDDDDPKVYIPKEVLDSLFGPPANNTKPGAKSSVPHFYSAIISNGQDKKPSLEAEVKNIFGSPPPEAMSALENLTVTNNTADFSTDDRFLSRTLMKTQWTRNRQASETEEMPKYTEKPEPSTLPTEEEPKTVGVEKERRILEPGPLDPSHRAVDFVTLDSNNSLETTTVQPKQLEPKSRTNGCGQNFSSKLFVPVFVCFCLERFFLFNSLA